MSNNNKYTDGPSTLGWTENKISININLQKNAVVKRMRNKLKEKKRKARTNTKKNHQK